VGSTKALNRLDMNLIGLDSAKSINMQVTDIYEKEVEFESSRRVYSVDGISKTIDTNETGYYAAPVLTPNRAEKKQNGRRFGVMIEKIGNIYKSGGENGNVYHSDGISPSLKSGTTSNPKHGGIGSSNAPKIANNHSIRRLTPVECCRLQGFPDDWNAYGEFDGEVKPMSDTQRYKQCGNAVTVNVVQAVAERIKN
tara:strand:- start:194 stop:781 length:588 start_codon:yes stop_codon:yes gene_type:complete